MKVKSFCAIKAEIQYAALIRADALQKKTLKTTVEAAQRRGALSKNHLSLQNNLRKRGASSCRHVPPMDLFARERKDVYDKMKQYSGAEQQIMGLKRDGNLIEKQEARLKSEHKGRWTYELIPNFQPQLNRRHGEVNYFIRAYLKSFRRVESAVCIYCQYDVDNVKQILFVCEGWEDKEKWLAIKIFVTTVYKQKGENIGAN